MNKKETARLSAINIFFLLFILGGILFAAFSPATEERMRAVQEASFSAAKDAVELAIGLIGIMALWLGLVRILEAGGFMQLIARGVKPVMIRLFPEVPSEHPAMGAMILNISANMLGLGNAATPFGIKAMVELDKLNPIKGTATNAMCLFLAINTSSVTILPLGVIGVRAAADASKPADIFLPTILATLCSTIVGIFLAKLLSRFSESEGGDVGEGKVDVQESEDEDYSHLLAVKSPFLKFLSWACLAAFFGAVLIRLATSAEAENFVSSELPSYWLMPFLMLAILCYGMGAGVKVYDAVTEGAKQGFEIAIRIIPFLVAILVAVAMFRASGAMELLIELLNPFTSLIGMPAEVLPMAIVRPLSGSGAFGIMSSIISDSPDSYEAFVASTMMGSTETTFYVLAVYFGAVGVVRIRYALVAALGADITGILAACLFSSMFY